MLITLEQVKRMIPTNPEPELWHSFCLEYFEKYEINTPNRIAGFFAQGAHESGDFKTLFENLNYSWERLRVVFPRYFPSDAFAKEYHRNPQKIANRVYDDALRTNKIGNNQPGDGWRFRGRGIFQLTGRTNYSNFAKYVGMTPEEAAAYCGTKRGAFESACWFWKTRNLNNFADKDDIVGMSKAVNGGDNGLADRKSKYSRNKVILKEVKKETEPKAVPYRMLAKGCFGNDVKVVQEKLGFTGKNADGIFGNATQAAVRSWQRRNGQAVTGRLTPVQVGMVVA